MYNLFYCFLTDWLDCCLVPPPISHLSNLSAFWLGLLQVLQSTDIDGCTVHIPCTQAENSTWHFPGAGLEAEETEHFCTDRQVQSFAHDMTKSRKPVAIKLLQNQGYPETIRAKRTDYSLKCSLSINYQALQNRLTYFIHSIQNSFPLPEGLQIDLVCIAACGPCDDIGLDTSNRRSFLSWKFDFQLLNNIKRNRENNEEAVGKSNCF